MKDSFGRRNRLPLVAACVLIPLFLTALASVAQQGAQRKSYAVIAGTVWNVQEYGASGLQVKVRRADDKPGKARWTMLTNARGEFTLHVPADKAEYIIWVDNKGHKGSAAQTTVEIDGDEVRDVALHLTE